MFRVAFVATSSLARVFLETEVRSSHLLLTKSMPNTCPGKEDGDAGVRLIMGRCLPGDILKHKGREPEFRKHPPVLFKLWVVNLT